MNIVLELSLFSIAVIGVIAFGIWKARDEISAEDAASVTESGKPAGKSEGVKFLRMEKNAAVYAVGSGKFQFESNL